MTKISSFLIKYATRPLGENMRWKSLKEIQANFLEKEIPKRINPTLKSKDFSDAANEILKDSLKPKGICFRTLALAIAEKYPVMIKNEIRDWETPLIWKAIWIAEDLDNLKTLKNKVDCKETDHRYEAFRIFFPPDAQFIVEAGSGVSKIVINWPMEGQNRIAIGVDSDALAEKKGKEAVKERQEQYPLGSKAEFRKGDIFNLQRDPELKFADACFSSGVLEHFIRGEKEEAINATNEKQAAKILIEMAKVVKNGGEVIVSVPNYDSPSIIARRWINGVKRRHSEDSIVHLEWPFGLEQPLKLSELKTLFSSLHEDGISFTNIETNGFNPFDGFLPEDFWKFKRVYGRTAWYMPNQSLGWRYLGMALTPLDIALKGKVSKFLFSTISELSLNKERQEKKSAYELFTSALKNLDKPSAVERPYLLEGDYIWYVPWYAPAFYASGYLLNWLAPKIDKKLDWLEKNFGICKEFRILKNWGNQIIVSAEVIKEGKENEN